MFFSGEERYQQLSVAAELKEKGKAADVMLGGIVVEIGIVACNQDFLMAYYYFG
jgi:hypothetical protein